MFLGLGPRYRRQPRPGGRLLLLQRVNLEEDNQHIYFQNEITLNYLRYQLSPCTQNLYYRPCYAEINDNWPTLWTYHVIL